MLLAFDTASTITPSVLDRAKADGVGVIWLYTKWATPELVKMIHAAGIAVAFVWETTAERALAGTTAGQEDGLRALMAVGNLGYFPPNVAIFFAVDFDEQLSQNPVVLAYGQGFTKGCAPQPSGVYGNGAACRLCKVPGCATYSWLAGGSGMRETREYAASGDADIVQDVGDARGEVLGISIDSDTVKDPTAPFAWHPDPQPAQPPAPAPATEANPLPDDPKVLQAFLASSGVYSGPIDGIVGPETQAAVGAYYAR